MYVHVCMYMYVCTCMYVCMCVMCMCACVYMYACIVTCRLRPTSAFHVTLADPGTEAYEGLRNGLRIDLPVTFNAAPLDCAEGGVSAHLVDTFCSVETDFTILTLLMYFFHEYKFHFIIL